MRYSQLILFFFIYHDIFSQSLSGIVEENNKPVSLVNISLLNVRDSTLEKAAVTDNNGYFIIEKIRSGTYLISATRIGYKQQFFSSVTIPSGSQHIELPVLSLVPVAVQLGEVTVVAKRPFVEQKIDRMVVNVANSIISSGSTALEVLEKAPGITIDRQNDQIIFRGKEGVIVQIDGKQTYLSMPDLVAMLRSMSSENIDRIELITNPSAKYDAAGNSGIIDIRLKKNNNIGTNGSLSVAAGSGRYGRQRGNLQINHRTAKLNLFTSYSGNREGNYWNFESDKIQPDGSQKNFIQQTSPIVFKNSGQNIKTGLDYFFNKNTIIGIIWTGYWSQSREKSPAETKFRRQQDGNIYFQTLTDKSLSNLQSNHLFNLNLLHVFKDKGQLSADLDLGKFSRKFRNILNTETLIPASPREPLNNLLSYMPTRINILSFKMDYTRSIGKTWRIEAGIKASEVKSDNDMQLSTGTNGNLKLDSTLSNHFKYSENVYAVYMSFSGKLNQQTEMLFGLRAEHTHSIANSITSKNIVTKNYLNLFPSLFITRSVNKKNTLTFSYSYRIDRPNYQSLNPVRSYIDPFFYSSGNSFLTPQFTHSFEFKHGFKNKLFTSIGASYTTDLVFFVVQPIDERTTQRMPENIGTSQAYNITVSFPVAVMKGWTMQNSLTGIFNRFQYKYKTIPLRAEQISGRLNSDNAFVLGKGWTAELSGRINSPSVNAISRSPWLGSMDFGFQKSFSKYWRAKITVQDVFHTNRTIVKIDVPEFASNVRITRDTRIVMLNITRSLGNQQLKNSRQRKTASEEEVQRTN